MVGPTEMRNVPAHWRLQEAKTQFSRVVDAALWGEPRHITRRGKPAVVVLSEAAFEAYRRNAQARAPGFVAHLLAMPRPDEDVTHLQAAPDIDRVREK